MTQPVTIITGASAGIGAALAREFSAGGHRLVLVARRERELNALADELAAGGKPRALVLPLDLTQPGASRAIGAALAQHDLTAQYVVNNAGFGLLGAAIAHDRDEQLNMVDLNVRALVDLSLAFVDDLASNRGGILNVASVAGFLPGPGMAVYYASKAFVLSFSEALHQELHMRNVRVTVLCPGPVPTEFQKRAGVPQVERSSILDRSAEMVAREGYRGLMAGRRLVVPGIPSKVATVLPRFLPRGLVVRIMEYVQMKRFGPGNVA